MKLLYTPIKDYSHTVETVIAYADLASRITPVPTRPFDGTPNLAEVNPLGTVPALLLDDDTPLYGGPVIYEYLDSLHDRPRLYPDAGPRRWAALRTCWLADGVFDATVRLIVESWEPRETQRPAHVARNLAKMTRALPVLARDATGAARDIGTIRATGALAFLVLKWPTLQQAVAGLPADWDWRAAHPGLAAWHAHEMTDSIHHFTFAAQGAA